MASKTTRKAAVVTANKGELDIITAVKNGSVDIWVKNHKKFLSAVASIAGAALSLGLLHGTAQAVVTLVVTALGALGVNQLDNTVTEGDA